MATSASQSAQDVVVDRSDGVLTLTLNRPARKNALSKAMVQGIITAVEGVAADDGIRVVALRTSADDFCTGIDLVESNDPGRGGGRPRVGH